MENLIKYKVEKQIYSKDILLRTCYSFIDDYYVFIESNSKQDWTVTLKTKEGSPIKDVEKLQGEFNNNLLNETFRALLMEKTKMTKEIIVARALFGAYAPQSMPDTGDRIDIDYSDMEKEMDDYLEDPLGIAVPWEEKKGKEKKADDK